MVVVEGEMASWLALAGTHIWTTRMTTIKSEIATVAHTRASLLLEQKNVSALDVVLRLCYNYSQFIVKY